MRRLHRFINDPSYWRARANNLRAVAAQATDPKVKATTFGAADAYDMLAQLEKARLASELPEAELPEATPQPVDAEREGALLSGLSSVRELDATNSFGHCRGKGQPPATTPGPAMTGDHETLGTLIYRLQDQHQVCRLPRAAQVLPIPGLPPADAPRAVPTRVPIDPYQQMPTPTLRRPGRTFLGGAPFPVAGAMMAAGAGFFVVAIWPPEMDFADAPTPVPSETHLVIPPPFPEAGLPPIQPKGRTAEGGSSEQVLTVSSKDKLTESGIEVTPPQALPATEYRTKGDTSAMPGSNSLHQASPRSSADAASDGQDSKPLIEGERPLVAASVHVSSCFPSASAVRQDYPEAWPSWTLRAPGHEGAKCWYAATRTAVHDPRGGIMARASGETSAMPGSNSVHPASPRSSADAASDGQDTKQLIERERPFVAASVHDSTCFPSASAVRQEYPEARPSWTLRAPGHEGTKCWYAATRATVYDH
jgi:hypothetical protein